jgi:recombination protein RecA
MVKKAAAKAEEKIDSLDIVMRSIGRDVESALVGSARNILSMHQKVIPTSLMSLNRILGKGGFKLGRVAEFYGDPGSGKSTLSYDVIKHCQQLGGKAVLIDAEHSADLDLLEDMGINVDDLIFVQGFSGEENLEVAEKLLKTGEIQALVVDSVTALIPEEELQAALGDHKIALHARLMSRALRKFIPICAKVGAFAIFINQIRFKVDGYGDPRVTTGGNALQFYSSYRIQMSGSGNSRLIRAKGDEDPYGKKVDIDLVKNKLSSPHRKTEAELIFGKGFDEFADIVALATKVGVIETRKSYYYYNDKLLAQGMDNLKTALASDLDLFDEIKGKLEEKLSIPKAVEIGKVDVETSGDD